MLVIDITLGIISRTMPQLNIFMVGIPLKIVVGLIIMMLTFTILVNIMSNMFNSMYIDIYKALKGMIR
jgi:flagellar biosynthetic protein FliR